MCGIIGTSGAIVPLDVLMSGLERLEYRGYDSSGVALVAPGGVWSMRQAGHLQALRDVLTVAPHATTGIGHTRWATHGVPSTENAHPHLDCSRTLALVHNGIIENHVTLRLQLEQAGHLFTSQTDTEVVAHLLEETLKVDAATGAVVSRHSVQRAIRHALTMLEGSIALALVHEELPDVLFAARRGSPLVVGVDLNSGTGYVASDIPAILEHVNSVYVIEDDCTVSLRDSDLVVEDATGNTVTPQSRPLTWDLAAAEKNGYPDFMLKEIHEQPQALRETLRGRLTVESLPWDAGFLPSGADLTRILIIACGTSYHSGLLMKTYLEQWAHIPVEVGVASEMRYSSLLVDASTLVIGISQSGETVDTLFAVREARRLGASVLALTNVVDSSLAREADAVAYTRCGPEIGVAATKTHTAQTALGLVLAVHLACQRRSLTTEQSQALLDDFATLPERVTVSLADISAVQEVAARLADHKDFFFLGRSTGFPVALEGALKLKEIAYLHAEGYAAGELKHGPIALIEKGVVVVALARRNATWAKLVSNVSEVHARGALCVLVAEDTDPETMLLADYVLPVQSAPDHLSAVLDVVPLQLLSYAVATRLGLNVDKPRNLAKTVTVE